MITRRISRRNGGRDRAGFTLIEVVVAMGILTVGILALIPALLFNIKSNTLARNRGLANQLAVQKLEHVKSWPIYYDYSTSNRGSASGSNTTLYGNETVSVTNSPLSFTRSTSVYTNGTTADCGTAILFGNTGNGAARNLNEGDPGGVLLNSGTVTASGCGSNQYRGEDFRMVLVTVTWIDRFGGHSIDRYQYLKKG
ncbi:MAG: prepilin-type N-terminal cleavage/methylation domain-containing protein [Candidatus Alcyoniella australis]|nr:prepilin-type N-terminal cleavage/methylation domain-containing protein [Candidatus Alcyoniella australis]